MGEVEKILTAAGGVCANAFEPEPTIKPDGSIKGGAKSDLRSYDFAEDGSYTVAAHLRTGKYDVLTYEEDKLVETEYDPGPTWYVCLRACARAFPSAHHAHHHAED